jgi:acyl carrier protein
MNFERAIYAAFDELNADSNRLRRPHIEKALYTPLVGPQSDLDSLDLIWVVSAVEREFELDSGRQMNLMADGADWTTVADLIEFARSRS